MLGTVTGSFAGGVASSDPAHGVVRTGDFAVTQNGTPNMSVDVAAGGAFIRGTQNANQGAYHVWNDGTVNLSIDAAHPTNGRKDLVIAQVRDAFYSGATNDARITVVTGTAAASPVDPSLSSFPNALVLARITVAAGDTAINTADITDLRPLANQLHKLPTFATAVARDIAIPTPYNGQVVYIQSNATLYSYNGTVWVPATTLVPHTDVTATTLTGSGTTASTSYVNLPGGSVAALSFSKYRADTKLVISMGVYNHYTNSAADFVNLAVRVNSVDYMTSSLGVGSGVRRAQYGTTVVTGLAIGTWSVQPRVKLDGASGGTLTMDSSCFYNIVVTETL
jgi:hypothetical protein